MFKQRGFSLIETAVAVGVIVSAIIVFGMFISSIRLVGVAQRRAMASHIATDQLEILRKTPFDNLAESGTIVNSDLSNIPQGAGTYTTASFGGNAEIKEANVYVEWVERGATRQVRRTTLLVRNGL